MCLTFEIAKTQRRTFSQIPQVTSELVSGLIGRG